MSSQKHTATCRKNLVINYDADKIDRNEGLDQEVKSKIVKKEVVVVDYPGLVGLLRSLGAKPAQFKQLIQVRKTVDGEMVKKLFDTEQLKIDDISGCYDAQIRKVITIT